MLIEPTWRTGLGHVAASVLHRAPPQPGAHVARMRRRAYAMCRPEKIIDYWCESLDSEVVLVASTVNETTECSAVARRARSTMGSPALWDELSTIRACDIDAGRSRPETHLRRRGSSRHAPSDSQSGLCSSNPACSGLGLA